MIITQTMERVIVQPKNKAQLSALKPFIKALKIDFTTEKSPCNTEFVKEVLEGVNARKQGNLVLK